MTTFRAEHFTTEGASALDSAESFDLRSEFVIPTQSHITSNCSPKQDSTKPDESGSKKCIYLCGNSLGLQPRRTAARIQQHLNMWATQGVYGHFKPLEGSLLPTWLNSDDRAASMMAPIVGAEKAEVAVMQTLTANLHLLMSAFYHPDPKGRHKIILESKAFPSDHFAVETQILNRGLDPETSMVCVSSLSGDSQIITTHDICSVISKHAASTAVLLLPGIQYYTGQVLDIPTITAFAHKHGIFVIWDLAHAVGNVPLKLHEWDVDAAAWCSYKYLNGGPGCIGGLFVHERNGRVDEEPGSELSSEDRLPSPRRLGGWWGNSKTSRFTMSTTPGFQPVSGAAGFQLSNPSVIDITSLCASLEVFELAGGVPALREKSIRLTGYLEALLNNMPFDKRSRFQIITPENPEQRGAQLSVLLRDSDSALAEKGQMLEAVMKGLEKRGVVVDQRKPNVVRVAPAPIYNSFSDAFGFVQAFENALDEAI